jgi:hypothetical protein
MQALKLVNAGNVDRVIVFDELPEHLVKGIRTRACEGFPRAWARWLGEIGSLRDVMKTETSVDLARNWTFKHTPIGKEPCFFVLEYTDINTDKEYWRRICDYLKANCGPEVRLTEKIEDMALALASDPKQPLSVEPEDIPVVVVRKEVKAPEAELVAHGETIIVQELALKKKAGRPKKIKEVVEA